MLSPTSTVRADLYSQEISGIGLMAAEAEALNGWRDAASVLAQAIRDALNRARTEGLGAFEPNSATLSVPASVSLTALRSLFAVVLRQPYLPADAAIDPVLPEHGPLSLEQWSHAEEALTLYAAKEASKLSPGAGGGPQYARGRWFVNGEPYSVAELLLTVRMNGVTALDGELANDLNALATNTELARHLMSVLGDMKRRSHFREAEAARQGWADAVFLPSLDYTPFVQGTALTVAALSDLGVRLKGAGSDLKRLGDAASSTSAGVISRSDYTNAMLELQSLFDSINAQNDVKKLRVDTLHNARTAMLEGMSAFVSSDLLQKKWVEQNL